MKAPFPRRFAIVKVFMTGRIPWRNILYHDMRGDEYYPQPHLYCQYADNGMPYEGFEFYTVGGGYEFSLPLDKRRTFEQLLDPAANKVGGPEG